MACAKSDGEREAAALPSDEIDLPPTPRHPWGQTVSEREHGDADQIDHELFADADSGPDYLDE